MATVPESARMRARSDHNLDEIAWGTVPADRPATLDDLMRDYVGHLEHHLRQILGAEASLDAEGATGSRDGEPG